MPSMGGKLINYHHMKWVILCTIFTCGMWYWGVTMHTWKSFMEIIMFRFPAASVHKAACPAVRRSRYKDTAAVELEMAWE